MHSQPPTGSSVSRLNDHSELEPAAQATLAVRGMSPQQSFRAVRAEPQGCCKQLDMDLFSESLRKRHQLEFPPSRCAHHATMTRKLAVPVAKIVHLSCL